MSITFNKKSFIRSLTLGSSFAKKNVSQAILESTKIEICKNDVFFSSSDMESCIKTRMPYDNGGVIFEPFCVSAKDLLSYIKLIPSEAFEMAVNESGKSITISHLSGQFDISIDNANNFPTFDSTGETVLSMDAKLLQKFIQDGRDFAADDELRPVMNCMFVYVRDGRIGYCVSDGHTLITDSYEYKGDNLNTDFLINKSAFAQILNLCADEIGYVSINVNDRNVIIKGENTVVAFRTVEHRYPNFNAVIPKSNNIQASISKTIVSQAIQRASISTSQSSHLLKMNFKGTVLEVCGEDVDFGRKGTERVGITCNGDILIGFKDSFFVKCLNTLADENVTVHLSEASRAATFTCDAEPNKTVLIMPMAIN